MHGSAGFVCWGRSDVHHVVGTVEIASYQTPERRSARANRVGILDENLCAYLVLDIVRLWHRRDHQTYSAAPGNHRTVSKELKIGLSYLVVIQWSS